MAALPYPRGLGFPDPPVVTKLHRFTSISRLGLHFGYPATWKAKSAPGNCCGRKKPACTSSKEGMMDPEARVSALAFHQRNCTYSRVVGSSDRKQVAGTSTGPWTLHSLRRKRSS